MIRYPGGEVALWSILWILAGSFVSYMSFNEGKTAVACVFAIMPLGCLLMWLDIRPAKWLVVFYLSIATPGAIRMTATKLVLARGSDAWPDRRIFCIRLCKLERRSKRKNRRRIMA